MQSNERNDKHNSLKPGEQSNAPPTNFFFFYRSFDSTSNIQSKNIKDTLKQEKHEKTDK